MKIAIATDHNGVEQKKELIKYLIELGYDVIDLSPNNIPTDDYPDYAYKVSNYIINNNADYGILMCGTGIGMSIAANKIKGIRAAKVSNVDEARLTRNDNDANILTMSYKLDMNNIKEITKVFLTTEFSNADRHIRRINKIKEIENL